MFSVLKSQPGTTLSIGSYAKLIVIGAIIAALVALLIAALFYLIEMTARLLGITNDRFEDLDLWLRMVLPVIGMMLILGFSAAFNVKGEEVGVSHALTRYARFDGEYPWRNAGMQFFSGWIALATGFSGGRDGPGLHLGAWLASLFQHQLTLTRAEREMLLRIGMTAAIAAGLHTTFAAAFFVMESIRTGPINLRSIPPLIVASFVATQVAGALGVDALVIGEQIYPILSLGEWFCVVVLGIPIAFVAMATMRLVISFMQVKGPFYARLLAITLATACLGAVFPDVLGLGYDTLEAVERGFLDLGLHYLIAFVVVKLLITSASVALGVPLGVIAPTLVNGGMLGAVCYVFLKLLFPDLIEAPISLYVLLGATALVGGVFNAPLAAVTFFLELTLAPFVAAQVAFAIVLAHICKIKLWGKQSIFEARLAVLGVQIRAQREGWSGEKLT